MGLETANKIGEMVPAWPLGSDPKAEGADHLNLIKLSCQGSLGLMLEYWGIPGNNETLKGQQVGGDYVSMIRVGADDLINVGQGNVGTFVNGSLLVGGAAGLTVTGPSALNAGVTVTGTIAGDGAINGAALNSSDTLDVLGLSTLNTLNTAGAVSIGGTLDVFGLVTLQQGVTIAAGGLQMSGNLTVTGSILSTGALVVQSGGAEIVGVSSVTGTLLVTGAGTFQSTVNVTGALRGGTIFSTGTLNVESGGFNCTGTMVVAGGLNITGPISILGGNNMAIGAGGNMSIPGGKLTLNTAINALDVDPNLSMRRSGTTSEHFMDWENLNNGNIQNQRYGMYLTPTGDLVIGQSATDRSFVINTTAPTVTRIILGKLTAFDPNVVGALYTIGTQVHISAG